MFAFQFINGIPQDFFYGIVCGFDVTFHPESARTEGKTRCIKVHPGTAIDCHGYPFRLCKAVEMKFEPEPCPTSDDPIFIYIAARRFPEGEQGREVSDDKCGEKPACVHARERDMVEINDCQRKVQTVAPRDLSRESSGLFWT